MHERLKLLKNTIIVAIGKFSTQILTFFLLPIYTAFLSTSEYGEYDLILTLVTFFTPIITLSLDEAVFRFLIDAKSKRKKKYIITQVLLYVLFSLIVSIIIIKVISIFFTINNINIIIAYLVSFVLISITNALVRGIGRIKLYSGLNFFIGILTLILNVFFILFLKMGMKGLLLSSIISNILGVIFVFIKLDLKEYISIKKFEKNIMKKMLKYSIPLVPNTLSWTIINFSDRIIITMVLGSAYNGVYSIANKFPTIINTLYSFFNIAWVESAAKNVTSSYKEKYYNNVYISIKNLLRGILLCIMAAMPFAFRILINENYNDAYYYIPILMIATYFSNMSTFLGGVFTAYKDTKTIGVTTIVSAIINLVVNISLIYFVGLYAAAISTLFATVTVYIYRRIKLKKYLKLEKTRFTILYYCLLALSIYIYYISNIYLCVIMFLISLVFFYFMNRENLKLIIINLFDKLKKK